MAPRVLSAILFSPRGGSAHVARALAAGLRTLGWQVDLVAGSRSDIGAHGDAQSFYDDVHSVGFDQALASDEPLRFEGPAGSAPMHPSFEDRPGAADRVFASLDDLDYERQVNAWSRELAQAGAVQADVIHLHHLTPLNEAAYRVAPQVPVVGQLHGTELLMLERILDDPPPGWAYAERWAARMRVWAARFERIVVAPGGLERAVSLLELPREHFVALPNGVDVEVFHSEPVERESFWRRVLFEEPQGCVPGGQPGSIRYEERDVARLQNATIFLYVGRFTAVKRLDLLIAAFAAAQDRLSAPAALVLVGGHP